MFVSKGATKQCSEKDMDINANGAAISSRYPMQVTACRQPSTAPGLSLPPRNRCQEMVGCTKCGLPLFPSFPDSGAALPSLKSKVLS